MIGQIPVRQHPTFPPKNFKGKYCLSPFVMMEVTLKGDVRLCGCGTWMPMTVGNLVTHSLTEILSSGPAQAVRQSIIDGTYEFCNEAHCGIIANDQLNSYKTVPDNVRPLLTDSGLFELPHWISIRGDNVCNLSCPSCRTGVIKPDPEDIENRKKIGEIISKNLFSSPTDKKIVVHISASGEVFASPLLLKLLSSIDLDRIPNLELHLQTNALLAPVHWHKILHLEPSIKHIVVSMDAATADTYSVVRRGGNWNDLVHSLEFIQRKKHEIGFEFCTRMVVQNRNFLEIREFYDLSKKYGVDRIEYSKLTDWGSWSRSEFDLHNVFDASHPNYTQTLQELHYIKNLPDVWIHGNIDQIPQ